MNAKPMKTRTVKVTRILTLSSSVIMEIPESLTNKNFNEALYDRCETYQSLLTVADRFDMEESDERIDVEDAASPSEFFGVTNQDWMSALKDDQLLDSL